MNAAAPTTPPTSPLPATLAALLRHRFVEPLFHPVLERFGLGLVIHHADHGGASQAGDEGSAIDVHTPLRAPKYAFTAAGSTYLIP